MFDCFTPKREALKITGADFYWMHEVWASCFLENSVKAVSSYANPEK